MQISRAALIVLVVLVGIATACGSDTPPTAYAPSTSPPPAPAWSASSSPRVYVSDETGGRVVAIDVATGHIAGIVAVGKRPRGLRLSHDGTLLFVALSGSPIAGPGVDESKLPPGDRSADGIGVIDLATGQLLRKLKGGQDPESFDLSPDGRVLYVSNEETSEMSIVDVPSGEVRSRVKVGGEPEGVTVRPDGREVYVTCEEDNEVVVVNAATGKVVTHLKVGARPRAIAFTADGTTGFVTNENDGTVSVIDVPRHKVSATITIPRDEGWPMPPRPMGAALSDDGVHVFISLGRARGVAVLDARTRTLLRTIDNVGERPWGIAVSTDGRTLYTANGPSADVSVVDVATGTVTKRIATGGSPWGVVWAKSP